MSARCDVLLFDLGGVLIELTGVPRMREWTCGRLDAEVLWRRWLGSPTVRAFETGRLDEAGFAAGVISEFGLPVDAPQFLAEFTAWARGPFPGAHGLLDGITDGPRLATLSNTNHLHWRRFLGDWGDLAARFDHHFPSHRTGWIKPDAATWRAVADELGVAPQRIAFFDDNTLNVDAARHAGMQAHRVEGVSGLGAALHRLGYVADDVAVTTAPPGH